MESCSQRFMTQIYLVDKLMACRKYSNSNNVIICMHDSNIVTSKLQKGETPAVAEQ